MDGVKVIRTRRKTVALSLEQDGSLVVRAPLGMSDREVAQFVESKQEWIEKKRTVLQQACDMYGGTVLSVDELTALKTAAQKDFNQRVAYWATQAGVTVKRVGIRMQRTRWGSCSSKGHLSLNALLMLAPEEVRDYVVVHELCHLKEMNHSSRFWVLVAQLLPEYRCQEAWLKENGQALLWRIGE